MTYQAAQASAENRGSDFTMSAADGAAEHTAADDAGCRANIGFIKAAAVHDTAVGRAVRLRAGGEQAGGERDGNEFGAGFYIFHSPRPYVYALSRPRQPLGADIWEPIY